MQAWIQARLFILSEVFSLTMCTSLCSQQPAAKFSGDAGLGPTVSIASLRVPDKAWQHLAKAKALAEHNRPLEAETESRKALALAPNFTSAYLMCASAQVQEHHFELAIESVEGARRIEPDAMWARVLLASAYNGLKVYDKSLAVFSGMRGPEAETWQASYEHARAAIGLGDVSAAMHWSGVALATAPESYSDVHLLRANALTLAHHWSEAAEQMELYLKRRGATMHRAEVMAALEKTRLQVQQEDLSKVALR